MTSRSAHWTQNALPAEAVIAHLKSDRPQKGFVHGASATPAPLLDALTERTDWSSGGVELYHLHLLGAPGFLEPQYTGGVRSISFFAGANSRSAIDAGRAEFIPVFLSEIPRLFTSRQIPLDFALIQVSPPDSHGLCTLGTSIDIARAAVDTAPILLAEINRQMPRTHGNTAIPFSRLTAYMVSDRPLLETPLPAPSEVEQQIGAHIAELIEDGSTLQLGIGTLPNAVTAALGSKQDLGVFTEVFSDSLLDLLECGAITNRKKQIHTGRTTTSFISGTERVFRYVHDHPLIEFHSSSRTNDTNTIAQNPKVVAINSALQIDLSGQIVADSLGHRIYSGIGGQMDFIRGASLSPGGKPIIALPSTAARGTLSRIVCELSPGSGVVTTRGHAHWIVTEFGAVNLHGQTLRRRAEALISIAHPDFRAELKRQLQGVRHFVFSSSPTAPSKPTPTAGRPC
jgi:4-hydroxybutyrate CoA-transferase